MKMQDQLDRIEREVKALRIEYEKYFAGVERLEPMRKRTDIKKRLRQLQIQGSYNTALKFRIQALIQSLVTHEQYWTRITRQIEEGTFKRDKLRAQKLMREKADGAAPAATQTQAPKTPAYDDSLRALHQQYASARKELGLSGVSIDSLARTIDKQKASIKERLKCRDVEFKVAVKDGKAILKAVPK